jgi:hypothetical protein
MILIEYLRENQVQLSKKGSAAMAKAIRDIFGISNDGTDDEDLVGIFLTNELKEEDCLKIIELTSKYAKLWLFS